MQAFVAFLEDVGKILNFWSVHLRPVLSRPTIPLKVMKEAYALQRECEEKKRLYFRITGSNKYIFASSTSQITEKAELKEAYDKIFVNGALSWSEYFESRFEVHLVQPTSRCPELFYECSCRQGSKKEVCRHATMVMCGIEKIVAYSAEATAAPMKGNRRKKKSVGRVPLAPRQHPHAVAD
ncbi:hypothetical protein AAVH_38110 [Aphelenchoides avenae]|nr:hypothetical protein AAVH_38110 [Aphelenchus avenae]